MTLGLRDAIELARAIVASTGHRANPAVLRLERNQARLEALGRFAPDQLRMLRFEVGKIVRNRLLTEFFHVHVERGKNSKTLAAQNLRRIPLGEFFFYIIDEVGRVVAFVINLARVQRLTDRGIVGSLADVPILEHRAEDFVAPLSAGVGMTQRIQPIGRADHARNRRHLADSQIARLFGEVVLTCFPDSVDTFLPALPQVDIVNIVFQNFIFRVAVLGDIRHQRFLDLAFVTPLASQEKVFHELLSQRRSALAYVAGSEIDIGSLDGTNQIDSMMLIEAVILGGQN